MNRLKSLPYSQKAAPYVFIAPFVIIFSIFFLYPIVSTIVMSFQKVVPGQTQFIGLTNYKKMWNATFLTALKNSAIYTVCTCAILIPVPMIRAPATRMTTIAMTVIYHGSPSSSSSVWLKSNPYASFG